MQFEVWLKGGWSLKVVLRLASPPSKIRGRLIKTFPLPLYDNGLPSKQNPSDQEDPQNDDVAKLEPNNARNDTERGFQPYTGR